MGSSKWESGLLVVAVMGIGGNALAAATVCGDAAPATIDTGDCTVAVGLVPTTVNFANNAVDLGTLILNGAAPTGAVTNTTDGQGDVTVSGTVSSGADIGVATTGDLASLLVNDAATFNLGHNLAALAVTVGAGTSGQLNQSAGTLTAATLAIAAGGTLTQSGTGVINAGNTTIATGGTLTLANQGSGAIDGAAAGQGDLVLDGSYDTDAALGGTAALNSITLNAGNTLTLDQGAAATTFTANGDVNQSAGTLGATNLAIGASTFTQSGTGVINAGNTTIATGGTLTLANQGSGAIDGAAAGQGDLVLDGSYDTDAAVGGTAALNSITLNAGNTLTLDQILQAGAFGIAGIVNKSTASGISAATTVQDGGTLNVAAGFTHTGALVVGGGTSGTLDVNAATVNVTGTVDMNAGSTFRTTINSATADDAGRLVASGIATIDAGTVIDLTVTASAVGSTYKIIDGAAGGAVSVPSTINDDSASLDFVASTDGNDLTLTALISGMLTGGLSPIGAAVDSQVSGMLASDAVLGAAVTGLATAAEYNAAMEALAPNMSGALLTGSLMSYHVASRVIDRRLAMLRGEGSMGSGLAAGDGYSDRAVWGQLFGSSLDQGTRDGVVGFDGDVLGLAMGADTQYSDTARIGIAAGYAATSTDTGNTTGSLDIDSYQLMAYSSYAFGPMSLDTSITYARNKYDSERRIQIGGVNRTATAGFDANQYAVRGRLQRPYRLDSGIVAAPYVGLNYLYLDIEGYTESGAGAANLRVDDQSYHSLQPELGISVSKKTDANGRTFLPEAHLAWRYETLDDQQVTTSTFSGGGGAFTTRGAKLARNAVNAGLSLSLYDDDGVDIKASYDYEYRDDFNGHAGSLVARMRF